MINAVELCMHLVDFLGGLLSSQEVKELEVKFIDVISVLNGNMWQARAIEFDWANILAML